MRRRNYSDFYLVLPLTRYNAFARGNYEINDWVGVFGQALFSHTETATRNQGGAIVGGWDVLRALRHRHLYRQPAADQRPVGGRNINVNGYGNPSSVLLTGMPTSVIGGTIYVDRRRQPVDNPTNPFFTSLYGTSANAVLAACANRAIGGCTNNEAIGQFFPAQLQQALNSRANPNAPVQLNYGIPEPRTVFTDVDTYNMTAGLEGSIPDTDFTWEAFVNHGESITFARQTGTYSLTRTRSLIQAPGFGLGYVNNSKRRATAERHRRCRLRVRFEHRDLPDRLQHLHWAGRTCPRIAGMRSRRS